MSTLRNCNLSKYSNAFSKISIDNLSSDIEGRLCPDYDYFEGKNDTNNLMLSGNYENSNKTESLHISMDICSNLST